jgi:hypothetical protein
MQLALGQECELRLQRCGLRDTVEALGDDNKDTSLVSSTFVGLGCLSKSINVYSGRPSSHCVEAQVVSLIVVGVCHLPLETFTYR